MKIGAATLTLSGNNTLTDGGILFAADAAGGGLITGGTLTAGNGEFIIQQHNTANALTVESALAAAKLTKSGAGDLIVSGTSDATIVNVNQGTLKLGADNALRASGTVNLVNAGATLDLNGHDLTVWSIQSQGIYGGQSALQTGAAVVVGNFAAGTEATLTFNRSNDLGSVDAFYGDIQTGAGAVLNIVKTGAGVSRIAYHQNGENSRGKAIGQGSLSQIYDIMAGNVTVAQGSLVIGRDLYVYGGLNLAAGTLLANCGAGQDNNSTPAFTGLTGAGNLQGWERAGYTFNLDGSAEMDVWTGQIVGNTALTFNGFGTQYVGKQTNNAGHSIIAAGKAVVITPGLTMSVGAQNSDSIDASPLHVAGEGMIKLTGTSGVVAGVGGVGNRFGGKGIGMAGGTVWVAPEGSGQNVTVSGMTANNNNTALIYGISPYFLTGNITALGGNNTLLLDRGGNTSLDFQLGNANSTNAKLVRRNNATLVFEAANGLAGFGDTEKLTLFGSGDALPVLTNGIMNTSLIAADGQTGAGSFLTTGAVTGGVVLKEATYETDLSAATATSVVKHSGDATLAANTAVYALRNDGTIANNHTLTVGTGAAGTQSGLIMNNAAITGSGTLQMGTAELTVYASGSNRIENQLGNGVRNNPALTLFGDGLLKVSGSLPLGYTTLNSGVLEIENPSRLVYDSNVQLQGGVLQTSGTFARSLNNPGQSGAFYWYAGGFAASSGTGLTVNIGNRQTLVWQYTSGFMSDYSVMKLGSEYAKGIVTLVNNIDLGTSTQYVARVANEPQYLGMPIGDGGDLFRQIEVMDNPDTDYDYAIISGVISGSMEYKGIQKSGNGLLMLTGVNTYNGPTSIAEGTLAIGDDSGLGAAPSAAAPVTGHVNQGTVLINGGATLLAADDLTISANRNILLASGSDGARSANIAVMNGATATFGGQLGDSVGEKGSLTVNGTNIGGTNPSNATGTLLLTGTSIISGNTEVAQGTLLVDGGLTTSDVIVSAGVTLGGAGDLATSSGGISLSGELDATAGIKLTLTGGKLNFLTGSTLTLDVADALTFSTVGDWLSGSGNATLNLSGISDYTISYTIFENVTTSGFTFASINGYDTQYDAVWEMNGNNYVLSFQQIPEPGTWALLVVGALVLTVSGLRRRKSLCA